MFQIFKKIRIKQFILFYFFIQISLLASSQTEVIEFPSLKLKKGIYFSFAEINENNPLYTDSVIIEERKKGEVAYAGGGNYLFKLPGKKGNEYRKIKKEFVGISDGENFYISDRLIVPWIEGTAIVKCILSGPYIIAPVSGQVKDLGILGRLATLSERKDNYLIYIVNGYIEAISKDYLKRILSRFPEVAEEYKDNKNLMPYSIEIINKVNKQINEKQSK